eukprot:gene21008-26673_t
METEPINDATLTGNVLFYKSPEPLSPENHGAMGISATAAPHAYIAETNVVPLTVAEFPAASLSYPIVFIENAVGASFDGVPPVGVDEQQSPGALHCVDGGLNF